METDGGSSYTYGKMDIKNKGDYYLSRVRCHLACGSHYAGMGGKKINILQASSTDKVNWQGKTLNMLVQVETETLEEIPEIINVGVV